MTTQAETDAMYRYMLDPTQASAEDWNRECNAAVREADFVLWLEEQTKPQTFAGYFPPVQLGEVWAKGNGEEVWTKV